MKRQVKVSVGASASRSVSESAGEVLAVTGTGLLDTYSGALAAYSVSRRLRDGYTGALLRVRRSSDNAEQDIGYVAGTGEIDTAALTTFVGAGDGFATTLYDQSGNSLNLAQSTAASQPVIVSAGVVNTVGTNTKPTLIFSGSQDMTRASTDLSAAHAFTLLTTIRRESDAATTFYVGFGDVGTTNGAFNAGAPASAGANVSFRARANSGSSPTLTSSTAAAPVNLVVLSDCSFSGQTKRIRTNAGSFVSNTATLTGTVDFTLSTNTLRLGGGASTPSFIGRLSEFIIWPSTSIAGTTDADSDLMTYYGIP